MYKLCPCLVFLADVSALTKELDELELNKIESWAVTGVLASHPNSTDVNISSLSLTFHGQELLSDTSLELNSGRRYGLIGLNGTGVGYRPVKDTKHMTYTTTYIYIFSTPDR